MACTHIWRSIRDRRRRTISDGRRVHPADRSRAPLISTQRAAIDAAVARVLGSGSYILGPEVESFERDFAAYIGCRHAVGVASGTDALVLALKALGLGRGGLRRHSVAHGGRDGRGDRAGGRAAAPRRHRSRDHDARSRGARARAFAAPPGRIAAVIPVHLYGQAADLDPILPLARRHGARVVEDCAQCHGARLGERRLGTFGDLAAFSFYPTKNLGASAMAAWS